MRNYLIIIVLYNKELNDVKPFNYFKNLESHNNIFIILYDNSPIPHNIDHSYNYVKYIHNPQNEGISKAYNVGAEYALKYNYDWLILFDQDTEITDNYLSLLEDSINQFPNVNLFAPIVHNTNGIMSPKICKYFRPSENLTKTGLNRLDNVAIINSGLVVSVSSFFKCGGYNNDTFLDFADYQFIERIQKIESSFVIFDSHLMQDFSNDETSIPKLLNRFEIYCNCLKSYQTTPMRRLMLYYAGFLHCLALVYRTKHIKFIYLFLKTVLL